LRTGPKENELKPGAKIFLAGAQKKEDSSQVLSALFFLNFEAPRRLAGTPALPLSLIELALNQVTRIEKRFIRRSRCRNG
jgi:hypothetical protein